ncbi:hypothetical protein NL503_26635, partial [Klebsiella pneumoniae]|nr:hypothetical protein [Klebsiella pneumoniae]
NTGTKTLQYFHINYSACFCVLRLTIHFKPAEKIPQPAIVLNVHFNPLFETHFDGKIKDGSNVLIT